MPWRKRGGGGYRTRTGGNVKRPRVYEGLRRRGASKRKAAKIANRR